MNANTPNPAGSAPAIAVIGGLLFSMYLTFYFMPAAFTLIMEKKVK